MEIFAGQPEQKRVELTPTLYQGESAVMLKEAPQNEKYILFIRQKLDVIVKRLRQLKKIREDDFDKAETE